MPQIHLLEELPRRMPQNTRVLRRVGGEQGLNYLCAGLQQFFAHATPHVEHIVADVSR
jgi:hypothetical protein